MLIVIKLFAEDQSELDSPELDSPMPSSFELEEEPEESESDDQSLLGADNTNKKHNGMLIVIKLFAEDQSDLDSPELGSPTPMSSSFELEEEPEESQLDDESLLRADTSERTPSVFGSELGSEGAESEPEAASVFRLFTPLSFRLPRKLRTRRPIGNSAATPNTSYLVPRNDEQLFHHQHV